LSSRRLDALQLISIHK